MDGFLLTLHRIPHSKNSSYDDKTARQPVFLQHGLLGSSADWILAGNKSLGNHYNILKIILAGNNH